MKAIILLSMLISVFALSANAQEGHTKLSVATIIDFSWDKGIINEDANITYLLPCGYAQAGVMEHYDVIGSEAPTITLAVMLKQIGPHCRRPDSRVSIKYHVDRSRPANVEVLGQLRR